MKKKVLCFVAGVMACIMLCMAVPAVQADAKTLTGGCMHASLTLVSYKVIGYPHSDYWGHQAYVQKDYECDVCGESITMYEYVNESHSLDSITHRCPCGFSLP